MAENAAIFGDLRKRHEVVMNEISALKEEMLKFQVIFFCLIHDIVLK